MDILIVAILFFQLYHLIRGTAAIGIFFGILILYLIWLIVKAMNMQLLTTIFSQFIGVGVIALIILFQQELRRFLLRLGSSGYLKGSFFASWGGFRAAAYGNLNYDAIVKACQKMSFHKTGALIVITKNSDLKYYINTGERIDSEVSSGLIESIFFKNNPLHDGAVIISDNRIKAAKCVLPLPEDADLPEQVGLRHRAAVGVTEPSDAIAIVISEQSGDISLARGGKLITGLSPLHLSDTLAKEFG